jgi:AcrR family transcriptional regulator
MEMKERILLKARELFQQYGVKSITMDEIASQLGVSKKTIYQFFSDKDELVLVVFSDFIDKIEAECSSLKNQFPNAILEVVNLMHYVLDLFSRINPVMLYDLKKFHPKAYQVFLNYKNEFLYNSIVANLKRGIEEGVYRKNLNVDILAKFRIESIELAFDQQLFPAGKYNLVEVQKVFIESYLFGISSLEGHKMISDYLEQQKNFRS